MARDSKLFKEYRKIHNDKGLQVGVMTYERWLEEQLVELRTEVVNKNDLLQRVMPRYLVANSTPTIEGKDCLTIGKEYEILHEHNNMVCVVDDYNEMEVMAKTFFNGA